MAKKGFGLLSGRIKSKNTGNFIGLAETEEYLGVPLANNSIIVTHINGSRDFYQLGSGLALDGLNDRVFVDETSVPIDTTGFNFSSATTLDQVLADLDANVNTAIGSSLTEVSTDSTISGNGTSGSPLSIGQAVTTTSSPTFANLTLDGGTNTNPLVVGSNVSGEVEIVYANDSNADNVFKSLSQSFVLRSTNNSYNTVAKILVTPTTSLVSTANMEFLTGTGTGLTTRLKIEGDTGNVVIGGTATADSKLTVQAGSNDGITIRAGNEPHLYLNTNDNKYQAVLFNSYGNIGLRQYFNDATYLNQGGSTFIFYHNNGYPNANNAYTKFDINGLEKLRLDSSGITVSGDTVITGNLTISGTTTTVNTEEINLADNIILLNSNLGELVAPTENSGIEINRGSAANVTLIWDEVNDRWTVGSQTFGATSYQVEGYGQVINSSGQWVGVAIPSGATSINELTDGFSDGSNVALGCNAMANDNTILNTAKNTALGICSLRSITQGECNTAIGHQALEFNSTASSNLAIGANALRFSQVGFGNVAVGNSSQEQNCIGNYNTSVGTGALASAFGTTCNDNVAIGYNALPDSGLVGRAVGIGSCVALNAAGNYPDSVFIGYTAGKCARVADTVVVGSCALGTNNIFNTIGAVYVGTRAALNLTVGHSNTIVGHESLKSAACAHRNVTLGSWTLENLVSGNDNVAVGHAALNKNLANGNVALGTCALFSNTTGIINLAIGNEAVLNNTIGQYNLGIGTSALRNNITGIINLAIGHSALIALGQESTTGNCNTVVGNFSLNNFKCGNDNVTLGQSAGSSLVCGSNNIVIGSNANPVAGFGDPANNQIVIGNANNDRLVIPGIGLDTNDALDGQLLQWNSLAGGFVWVNQSNTLSVATSSTAPSSPLNGAVWFDTTDGTLAVYYDDGTSAQWVTTSGPQGCIGYTGSQGQGYTGSQGSTGYTGSAGQAYIGDLLDAKSDASFVSYGIGTEALAAQTFNGSYNTAVGYRAACSINSNALADNVYFGPYAGANQTSGMRNVVLGAYSGGLNATMNSLISIGFNAAYGNNNSCDSVIVGTCAAYGLTRTNGRSVVLGSYAGKSSCNSVVIGYEALCSHIDVTLGQSNVAIGAKSLKFDLSGSRNIAVGEESILCQTCGDDNIGIGYLALRSQLTGLSNIAIGSYSLTNGGQAVCNTWLGNNIAIGYGAGQTLGVTDKSACVESELINDNVFIGTQAGTTAKDAKENTFIGGASSSSFYDGNGNISIGYRSGLGHRYGDNNITIGYCIGPKSGFFTTESNKIVIGNSFNDGFKVGPGGIDFYADANSITIAGTTEVRNHVATRTAITQFAIAEFAIASYAGGKFVIQATDNVTSNRHITEVIMTHDGTTAIASEFGILFTSASLFTVDVDISAGNARVLITPASANSTKFTISGNMMLA